MIERVMCKLSFSNKVLLIVVGLAAPSEYHGQVTFGGLPVPGATVTATLGAKQPTTATRLGGSTTVMAAK